MSVPRAHDDIEQLDDDEHQHHDIIYCAEYCAVDLVDDRDHRIVDDLIDHGDDVVVHDNIDARTDLSERLARQG